MDRRFVVTIIIEVNINCSGLECASTESNTNFDVPPNHRGAPGSLSYENERPPGPNNYSTDRQTNRTSRLVKRKSLDRCRELWINESYQSREASRVYFENTDPSRTLRCSLSLVITPRKLEIDFFTDIGESTLLVGSGIFWRIFWPRFVDEITFWRSMVSLKFSVYGGWMKIFFHENDAVAYNKYFRDSLIKVYLEAAL